MRRLLVQEVPRDQHPELTDPRWPLWSRQLRSFICHSPTSWPDLLLFAEATDLSGMALRQVLGYLEEVGYAASQPTRAGVLWCGCQHPCSSTPALCPKLRH